MKCEVLVRGCRGNSPSHTHALFACSVTADKQTLSRGGVKHLSEAPPSPNRTSTEASRGMKKAIKCGGGRVVRGGVPGQGRQAEGSNERVEEKQREKDKQAVHCFVLPGCPGGWARPSSVLNACRSLF